MELAVGGALEAGHCTSITLAGLKSSPTVKSRKLLLNKISQQDLEGM